MLGLEILDLSKVKEHQVIDLHDNVRYALDCSSFDGLMRVAQFKGDLLASEVSRTVSLTNFHSNLSHALDFATERLMSE